MAALASGADSPAPTACKGLTAADPAAASARAQQVISDASAAPINAEVMATHTSAAPTRMGDMDFITRSTKWDQGCEPKGDGDELLHGMAN